jgi:filamentous hemagglutinin
MTYKLTGLEPYQLPSNADLGTMAYQNAEALQAGLVNISNTLTISGLIAPLTVGYSQAAVGTLLYLNQVPSNLMTGGTVSGSNITSGSTLTSFVSGFSTYQPSFTATTATTVIAMTSTYGISASMAVGGTGITYGTVVSSVSGTTTPVTYQVTSATTAGTTIWIGTTTNVAVNSMVFGTGVNNTNTLVTVISANSYVTVNQAVTTTLGQNITFAPTVTLSAAITANTQTQNLLFFPTVTLNQATSSAVTQGTVVNSYYSSSNATNAALVVGAGGLGVTGNAYFANSVTATNFYGSFTGNFSGTFNTATNLANGTAGQVPYQTAAGATSFFGPGTLGQLLVSAGTSAPVYTNTASIYVGAATSSVNLFGGAAGSIPYQSAANATTLLGIGTNGFVLTSNGTAPVWSALSGLSAGSATTATNLANGTAGQIPYQIAPGNTGFVGPGSYGQFLMSNGANAPLYQSTLTQANGNIIINSITSATSTNTGALQVVNGGVGIGGALYVGGNAYIGSTVTSGFILGTIPGFNSSYSVVWPTAISTPSNSNYGLAIGASDVLINSNARITLGANTANTFRVQSGTPSYTAASGQSTVILSGGLGVTGDSFVNGALGIGSTTSSMSTTTGALIVAGGVGVGGGLFVGGAVTSTNHIITASTSATSTTTGALIVAGGAGIGGNLFVGGTTYLSGDLYIDGTQTVINSVLQATQDKTLTLGNTLLQASTNGAGIQIGSTTSPFISWLYDGINSWKSSQAITVTTTATIQGTTNATSTTSGALQVAGGVGVGGDIYGGGNLTLSGSTQPTATVSGTFPSFAVQTITGMYSYNSWEGYTYGSIADGKVWTIGHKNLASTATLFFNVLIRPGSVNSAYSGDTVFAAANNQNLRISFAGTTTIYSTASSVSTTTGALVVAGGLGIGGNFYSAGNLNIVGVTTITNTASVSSTSTGALQVAGGVGVAGGMFVGGTVTATLFMGTFLGTISGVISTSTNIAGGTAGALHYQSAPGVTAFAAISTAGYVLQSSGTIPQWVDIGPTVLNDISSQFDGSKTVFNLRLDQNIINTVVDSKDLEVVIGGQRLAPYVDILSYPWLTPYDSFKGFRVKSSTSTGQVVIYNAPYRGDTAVLTLRQQTKTRQKRKYPYSATTIAFGD